jgi:hypothetical protein
VTLSRKGKILAVCSILILLIVLSGTSYYFLSSKEAPSPVPTATPAATATPQEVPPTFPSVPKLKLEVASTEGFDHARSERGLVVVLRQGTSGNITVRVSSTANIPVRATLTFSGFWKMELEGIDCAFYPSTVELPAGGEAYSTLVLEAASNATNIMIWDPDVFINVDGSQVMLGEKLGLSMRARARIQIFD